MKQKACVWRESIYKNNFRCNECGTQLCDENGAPKEDRLIVTRFRGKTLFVCKACGNAVAYIQKIKVSEPLKAGLQGDINKFRKTGRGTANETH